MEFLKIVYVYTQTSFLRGAATRFSGFSLLFVAIFVSGIEVLQRFSELFLLFVAILVSGIYFSDPMCRPDTPGAGAAPRRAAPATWSSLGTCAAAPLDRCADPAPVLVRKARPQAA